LTKKKKFLQGLTKSKNTRGWFSSFLTLISNPPSEFSFHFENPEKNPFFHGNQPKYGEKMSHFSTHPNFEKSFSEIFFHSYDIIKGTV
jgi:hypothetical protein